MEIGLLDVDSHNYPNLPLMKISAYHKAKGDNVEWLNHLKHYDIAYVSKVFGDEYSKMDDTCIDADLVIGGGTGFAIKIEDGKEVYCKEKDGNLPYEVEHIYPDYSLYPEFTGWHKKKEQQRAFGFMTRGCPNNCSFCIVSKKEGRQSIKTAELSEFWKGQGHVDLLDANILACKDRMDLLQQIVDS